jgi:PAS domain S-box-containing protein
LYRRYNAEKDFIDMPLPSKEELIERIRELEQENQHLRQAQAGSREQAAYFAAILDNTPAPIYLKDVEYRYLLVNKQYELLSQTTLHEIKGKSDFDIFPTAIAELFRTQDEAVLEQNRPLEFEETIPLSGGVYSFITSKFPVHDADGNVYAVAGFCTDITERKEMEKEREDLIAKLRKALEEVRVLRGILPICARCKKIRDDKGYWNQLEEYLRLHSEAECSHGLCPECSDKLYGDEHWYIQYKSAGSK